MDQQMKPLSPYFSELSLRLSKEGYTVHIGETDHLSADWQGLPLCRITADGGVRYWQEDVATPERERACERATDLACTVREYMTLLEQAPPLQAQSLTGDYRLLLTSMEPCWPPIPPGLASNSSHGTGASTAQVSTRAITFRKIMQVPSRTSPSAPASFPNSRSSIRSSLSKSTGAALTPWMLVLT